MRFAICLVLFGFLSGCAFIEAFFDRDKTCRGANRIDCAFVNAPLRLLPNLIEFPGRPYTFKRTENAVQFIDKRGYSWVAPRGTLTDGASIPPIFIPLIGLPTSEEFAVAAAVHDAYCGYGNEKLDVYQSRRWRRVHRMFFEALVQGGTPELKAKAMYAAVMTGGPRWSTFDDSGDENFAPSGVARPELGDIPETALIDAFEDILEFVDTQNPTLNEIDTITEIVSENTQTFFRPPEERGFTFDPETGMTFEWQGLPPPAPPGSPSAWLGYDQNGQYIGDFNPDEDLPDLSDDIVLPPPLDEL